MDIKKLLGFRSVVKNGSLTLAADRMYLSQSAMSRLISSLEDELKISLFERRNRRLILTAEGEAFYNEVESLLEGFESIPKIIDDIKRVRSKRLHILADHHIGSTITASSFADFFEHYSEQQYLVDMRKHVDMDELLGDECFDVGIKACHEYEVERSSGEPLFKSKVFVAVSIDHPLATEPFLAPQQMVHYPIIGLYGDSSLSKVVEGLFRSEGIELTYSIETSSILFAAQAMSRGVGVFITDTFGAENAPKGSYVRVPLVVERYLYYRAIYPRNMKSSIIVGDFISSLKGYVESNKSSEYVQIVEDGVD